MIKHACLFCFVLFSHTTFSPHYQFIQSLQYTSFMHYGILCSTHRFGRGFMLEAHADTFSTYQGLRPAAVEELWGSVSRLIDFPVGRQLTSWVLWVSLTYINVAKNRKSQIQILYVLHALYFYWLPMLIYCIMLFYYFPQKSEVLIER